jgi:tetratricopeptide (TPR) repeat protein
MRAQVVLAALIVSSCASKRSASDHDPPPDNPLRSPAPAASLPDDRSDAFPALVRFDKTLPIKGKLLAEVSVCGGCHPDVLAMQQASAHGNASFDNPIYRYSVEELREVVGLKASRMCAGCHDPSLLIDGAMDRAVKPDDVRAHAGVTCRTCHGISETRPDGNGSYLLGKSAIPVPRADDKDSVERHRLAARPIDGDAMCGSCHRAFLSPATGNQFVLAGMDDFSGWRGSAYNHSGVGRVDDELPRQSCAACHMPKEAAIRGDKAAKHGMVSSHRFAGGHTWLAAMQGDEEQLAAQTRELAKAVTIDIAAARLPDGSFVLPAERASLVAGQPLEVDVVLRNVGVGHRFPAGVSDAQDTWLEVRLLDRSDRVIAQSGVGHATAETSESEAHVLRALVADDQAKVRFERDVHAFAGKIVDHTIAARDVAVIRYRFEAGKKLSGRGPYRIEATLRHRSRNLAVQKRACAEAKSERGVKWASMQPPSAVLDPCPDQPVTDIARASVVLAGKRATSTNERPLWRRLYEHGLGMLHAVQERTDEARPSLERALELVEDVPRSRAMVLAALGALEARQGRTKQASEWLDKAEALVPGHPAVAFIRGQAHARVWQWEEAVEAFRGATKSARANANLWRAYSIALGSLGRDKEALAAAKSGLVLRPRDPDLLRVQALSLEALGAPPADVEAALESYARFRPPDGAAELRVKCAANVELCRREREPVHTHELLPPR